MSRDITASGGKVIAVEADISREHEAAQLFARAVLIHAMLARLAAVGTSRPAAPSGGHAERACVAGAGCR